MAAIDFPQDLIEKERSAWEEIQRGGLTVATALEVHAGVVAFAERAGLSRLDVETQLKRIVRHPAPESDAA